jgi:hypothetical protein
MSTNGKSQSNKQARKKRISAELPISVGAGKGLVRDISASGMFIVQSGPQEIGARIDFTIDLNTPIGMMKLSCEGTVVRIQEVDGKIGIGVKIIKQFGKRLISDKLRASDTTWNEVD